MSASEREELASDLGMTPTQIKVFSLSFHGSMSYAGLSDLVPGRSPVCGKELHKNVQNRRYKCKRVDQDLSLQLSIQFGFSPQIFNSISSCQLNGQVK